MTVPSMPRTTRLATLERQLRPKMVRSKLTREWRPRRKQKMTKMAEDTLSLFMRLELDPQFFLHQLGSQDITSLTAMHQ